MKILNSQPKLMLSGCSKEESRVPTALLVIFPLVQPL